jgi:crotonobetainyl-CoA:carnitine CoA-transferase CaiB-like acyl-CoA transferase
MHSGVVPGRQGRGHESIPTYRSFACRDGVSIVITANTERMWQGLARVLRREDLLSDPRFVTNTERLAHREALWPILDKAFLARSADEWLPLLEAEEIPVGVVNTLDRVVSDPQLVHRNMLLQLEGAEGQNARVMGNPIKFKDADRESADYPRDLGADTAEVLRDVLRLSAEEIANLIRGKAIITKA